MISFYVIACNQERFIAEAVAGALAQTWTPLEVVLSDDCSDDRTFEIMQEMACAYRGPHKIVLNRNERRLGVGAHINRILQLCRGDWIVASAGDDVSVPERTAKLRACWEADGGRAGLVFSNLVEVDENGVEMHVTDFGRGRTRWDYRLHLAQQQPPVHGASFGYPRRIYDEFGPLWAGVVFEDNVLNWRAELTGGVLLCPEALVRHRNHQGQLTNLYSPAALQEASERRRSLQWSNVVTRRQNLHDLRTAFERGWIEAPVYRQAERILSDWLQTEERNYDLYWGHLARRWRLLLDPSSRRNKRATQLLFAALPRPLYLFVLRLVAKQNRCA